MERRGGSSVKSHNRIPRSRILLVAVVVLLAVVICAELLAMRAMREKADASDVIQTLPEGDGETEPAAVDSAEPTDLRSPAISTKEQRAQPLCRWLPGMVPAFSGARLEAVHPSRFGTRIPPVWIG